MSNKWLKVYTAPLLFMMIVGSVGVQAQNDDALFLVFEFMVVDNEQEEAYEETERFWKKIHEERVAQGQIIGWDLWSLQPGGEQQGYQYMTVTLYDDPVKMMSRFDLDATIKKAYPEMSEEDIQKHLDAANASRDLAARVYLEQVASTDSDFSMDIGTIASVDMMKVDLDKYNAYEEAEMQIFQPLHQENVDEGYMSNWALLKVINPIGSDAYMSHITVNMFENWEQVFDYEEIEETDDLTFNTQSALIQAGLQTRDMRMVYFATLIDMVR
jgi:hypothetical protein